MHGRYNSALRHLKKARKALNKPPIAFETGKIYLKQGLQAERKKDYSHAKKLMKMAAKKFRAYLARAPHGKQAKQARGGLDQVRRHLSIMRRK
jgi:tetratricopeptide (TPR) repeat protein